MAATPERMQEIRLDLLNLIEVYKDMLESVNPVFLLSEYGTEEGAPTDDEMNRLRDEVLPKIHQRYLTLYSTIEDKVSQMLRQYGELSQEALQSIGENSEADRMDLRLGLSTEIQRGIAVITDALKALKPRDVLQSYRSAKRPPSRTFDMMFRELEPKIQKKYLDTVSDSYEILIMLAEKAAAAAMVVKRESGLEPRVGQS
ncbi:MAG: hypothetical protein M1319_06395 [Chloroflexi bacterium]|nr:hypothetical protein [Chloroflexota bacterium]